MNYLVKRMLKEQLIKRMLKAGGDVSTHWLIEVKEVGQVCQTPKTHENVSVMWKTVSEACNLACDYCYYSTCGGQPIGIEKIRYELLEKFIKEYMELDQRFASFIWQGGEPLLAGLDFFKNVIKLQKRYASNGTFINNSLQTNATLITDEWALFFKQNNFFIGVSLDGPKEINDIRRVNAQGTGSFECIMRGIDCLRKYNVDFNILSVIHEENVDKAKELMRFYQKENFTHVQLIPCMDFQSQLPDKPGKYVVTPEQYGDFLCEAFDVWYNDGNPVISVRFFDNMLSIYLDRQAELCIHHQICPRVIVLEQNGDAYPCDFYINEKYKVGNVGVDRLHDILNNPVYSKFLDLKPDLPEKCRTCKFIKSCYGGCPRNRAYNGISNEVNPDYFCESYMQIYAYSQERIEKLAEKVRINWVRDYLRTNQRKPGRNNLCICGSGKKFKKCCGKFI